jgi:hypothetical protein
VRPRRRTSRRARVPDEWKDKPAKLRGERLTTRLFERRAHFGRMCEVNRTFSPLSASVARSHLRPPDLERADPGLDPALRAIAVAHDALPSVRQPLLGELSEEDLDLGLKGCREHPARALSGADETGRDNFLHGVSLLLEGSGRLDHPRRYAAFSTPITQFWPSFALSPNRRGFGVPAVLGRRRVSCMTSALRR